MRQSYDVADQRTGHLAALNLWQHCIKPQTAAGGRGRLTWESIDPAGRVGMLRLFHGPLLADFAEQVRLLDPATGQGVRYVPAVWKEHLKDLFCPATFDAQGNELPKSVGALSDGQLSQFITACQAYGVVDCGVTFTEQDIPSPASRAALSAAQP